MLGLLVAVAVTATATSLFLHRRQRRVLTERIRLLAAAVAHEINNPLSYVLSNVRQVREDLARGDVDLAAAREALADAEHGALRIRDIVREMSGKSDGPVMRATEPGSRRALVAVIDDEPLVAKAVERMLARDHDVRVFLRAADFVGELASGVRFDAIVCDVMMPDVSGVELYEKLPPDVAKRVIFMTGGAFTQSAVDFLARVGNRRLDKPFDREQLLAAVREVAG